MPVVRPLPPRPSLEFDRKNAKTLLRELRSGDTDAIARAHAQDPSITPESATRATLAIVQLLIAREYGFTSWPRLVQYHDGIVRQSGSYPTFQNPEAYDSDARAMVSAHGKRGFWAGRLLAAYVPRFFGMKVEDVYTHAVTEDDTRLAIARSNGCPSWEVLLERAAEDYAREVDRVQDREWGTDPWRRAHAAIDSADLGELQRIVEANPQLVQVSKQDIAIGRSLLYSAFAAECTLGRETLRPIVEWLASQGQDLNASLNMLWYGKPPRTPDEVQRLINRGADPNWVPPSGIPILERMLLRLRQTRCADVIAKHVTPRDAMWIAAGLGNVDGVARFLDKDGKPTAAARALRPPLDAMHGFSMPVLPDPDDMEILHEAFWVAALNDRVAVMDYMISRGYDVNCQAWGTPLVNIAVGNGWTSVVECLVRAGANLDVHEGNSNGTARDMARTMWASGSHGPRYRRIVELCGLDADAILAEANATPVPTPRIHEYLQRALDLAEDDAQRQGQTDVQPENLLFGLLRVGGLPVTYLTLSRSMDRRRLFETLASRVNVGDAQLAPMPLPLHPAAQTIIEHAIAKASERRRETVTGLHLLWALSNDEHGHVATLLECYGSSRSQLRMELERGM